jgi:WD40 repeat protein
MSRAGVKLKAACLGLLALLFPLLALAAEPPILRLETGMHTASINRIAVDAGERFLVTASDDKTARLWSLPEGRPSLQALGLGIDKGLERKLYEVGILSLPEGRLLQVLRPPIGGGNEGKLYAVAISPDARTIAAGGWTARENNGSIYLFDRQSGRLTRRVGGLPNTIQHLAYSKDGRFLAAGLFGDNGIRIYRSDGYALAAEDRDYGDTVYGLDFASDGRLATVSYDGFVRLYGSDLKRIEKRPSPGSKKPRSVSFSPDGGRLVVGFYDSTRIAVLSGRDLEPVYSPDSRGIDNGMLSSVAWSSDGRFLYAGGTYNTIFRWKDAGRGERSELPAASQTVMQIVSLKSGGVAFGAGDPAFGIIDASGQKRLFRTAATVDFSAAGEAFRLSQDGATVQFGFEPWWRSPARFSVNSACLRPGLWAAAYRLR